MAVDPNIREQVYEVMQDVLNLPPDFVNYVGVQTWLANSPVFPISQVFGFTQFTANTASTAASESTSSTSYTDLATTGPFLSGLADGNYLIVFGTVGSMGDTTNNFLVSPQINSAAASDTDFTLGFGTAGMSAARAVTKALSNNGSNTITLKYRVTGGTGTFTKRWLVALKYGNL